MLKCLLPMRGATAYEIQWCRLGVRLVHLRGGRWGSWRHRPWQRVSFQWFGPGPEYPAENARR
jgi:hypothetical protein